jgi:hypothetical protein
MPEKEETNLRVFNTAKKFAEEILFPIMETYQKFKRQSDFGSENMDNAQLLNEEIKEIGRYNGLKGMNDTVSSLVTAITSTIRIKANKEELNQITSIGETVSKIKTIFYEHRERFFSQTFRGNGMIDVIDRNYFEKIKQIIETCYINTEILMTKNKLLFSDAKEDYESDAEIRLNIKKEYIEG